MFFELPEELEKLWGIIEPYAAAICNGAPVPDEIAEVDRKFREGYARIMDGVM